MLIFDKPDSAIAAAAVGRMAPSPPSAAARPLNHAPHAKACACVYPLQRRESVEAPAAWPHQARAASHARQGVCAVHLIRRFRVCYR